MKCKGCDRVHDITLQPYEDANAWVPDSKEEWQRIATFEIRGMDPTESEVRDGFIVNAVDGTKYEDGVLTPDFSPCWPTMATEFATDLGLCFCLRQWTCPTSGWMWTTRECLYPSTASSTSLPLTRPTKRRRNKTRVHCLHAIQIYVFE